MKGLGWPIPLGSHFRGLSSGRVHRDGMRKSVKNECHLSLEALCEKCSLISSCCPLAVHEAERAEELLGFVLQVSSPQLRWWRVGCGEAAAAAGEGASGRVPDLCLRPRWNLPFCSQCALPGLSTLMSGNRSNDTCALLTRTSPLSWNSWYEKVWWVWNLFALTQEISLRAVETL